MPNLYPAFEVPEPVEQQQAQPEPEYPESYLFDFEKGEFVRDGAGRIAIADGHTAWVQWCIKAVMTERFTHLIYSSDYGVEIENALKQPTRAAKEADLERTITEALMIDPRTKAVKDFSFTWEGDQLWVAFTIEPTIGDHPERLEVRYSAV